MSETLTEVLDTLKALSSSDAKSELSELLAIREWALSRLGVDYKAGDHVEIISHHPSTTGGGWHCYREALAVGATGVAGEFRFNQYSRGGAGDWQVPVVLDREWSVSEPLSGSGGPTRYWNGSTETTPDGFTPPSKFTAEHYPEGRRGIFYIAATHLAAATPPQPTDQP